MYQKDSVNNIQPLNNIINFLEVIPLFSFQDANAMWDLPFASPVYSWLIEEHQLHLPPDKDI